MRMALIFVVVLLVGCSDDRKVEDFVHEEGDKKGVVEFKEANNRCKTEKDKFSNKIQGREMGFEGEHTGYLACMKLKGWSQR